jgi:hypothetical protein
MNTGAEDALGAAWRLAAMVKGYGGSHLLPSYEVEQRPIMSKRLMRCDHWIHSEGPRYDIFFGNPELTSANTEEGHQHRESLKDVLVGRGPECKDRGTELDARYRSVVIFQDDSKELEWSHYAYMPSTKPGARAPVLFLKDGKTNIIDLYGKEFTLVSFVKSNGTEALSSAASSLSIPLKVVEITEEKHAHKIWGINHAIIRADGHVAWRGNEMPSADEAVDILKVVTGQLAFPGFVPPLSEAAEIKVMAIAKEIELLGVDEKPVLAAAFQY